jgi:Tfp pilus assembly protein PilN
LVRFKIDLASGDHLKKRMVFLALYLAMIFFVVLIGFDIARFYRIRESEAAFDARMARLLSEKQSLQKEIGQLGQDASADSMKALRKEIAFINELLQHKRFSWTSFLSDLEKRVPPQIAVTRIQPDFKSGLVILGGAARSLKALTEFVGNLQKGPPFEEVFLTDQETLQEEGKLGLSFSIRFKYEIRKNES